MTSLKKIKLGVLASGRGTSLEKAITAINQGALAAEVKLIISNKKDALVLGYKEKHGIKTLCIPQQGNNKQRQEYLITTTLQRHNVDLILLIGYSSILSPVFILRWNRKILNIHPSLLPDFSGLMDLNVHRAVLQSAARKTGCTVHYVDNIVDGGSILLQKSCLVLAEDTPETLKTRVQALEGEALIEAIQKFCA